MPKNALKRLTLALLIGVSFLPPGVQAAVGDLQRGSEAPQRFTTGPLLLAQDEESYEEPAAEEPAYEEPAAEEPAYEEPAAEEAPAEEPAYEEPAPEETVQDEPAAEEPQAEEPAAEEQPQEEQPAAEDQPETEEPADEAQAPEDASPEAEAPADEAQAPEDAAPEAEEPSDEAQAPEDAAPDADGPSDEAQAPEDAAPDAEEPSDEAQAPDEASPEEEAPSDEAQAPEDATPDAEAPADEAQAPEDATPDAEEPSDEAQAPDEATPDGEEPSDEASAPEGESPAAEEAAAVEEAVEDPAADAAVEAAVQEEAEEPLVDEAPAEPVDEAALLSEEGIADEADAPEDVAAEVEQAEAQAPDADEPIAETIEGEEGVAPEDVAPLFDSAKRASADEVAPDEVTEAPAPRSDAEVQAFEAPADYGNEERFGRGEAIAAAPSFERPSGDTTIVFNQNNTTIYEVNQTMFIDSRVSYEERLSYYGYSDFSYERYEGGYYSERARSSDGSYVFTRYDRYGNVIERSYRDPNGRSYVLAWYDVKRGPIRYEDVGRRLPPLKPRFPASYYVLDYRNADAGSVYRHLRKPPVEKARRLYAIDEVKRSSRLRDTLPRVEIGNLNFATGSAKLGKQQAAVLKALAAAMLKQIRSNPAETFLIEGHTDAVGSSKSNLVLSDRRAKAVAEALTRFYRVPPQNLATQGYGEEFLKVRTAKASAANRRVTVRRTTPLVTPVAKR